MRLEYPIAGLASVVPVEPATGTGKSERTARYEINVCIHSQIKVYMRMLAEAILTNQNKVVATHVGNMYNFKLYSLAIDWE